MFERTLESFVPWACFVIIKSPFAVRLYRPHALNCVIWDVTSLKNFNIVRINLVTVSSYARNIMLASENIMLSVCACMSYI
jgi:hypothetical protein